MKIIKQLSDDTFIVQMYESDLSDEIRMVAMHDYVEFSANQGIIADAECGHVTGPFAFCTNWIKARHKVQIGIRDMVKFVLPYLNKNEYCTEEHLLDSDGTPNYNWDNRPIFYYDNGQKMVAYHKEDDPEITIVTEEEYNSLINKHYERNKGKS